MAHSRDIRVHASEVKFLVQPDIAARVRDWARAHMDADPNGAGVHGDEYRTTSLYFDTDDYDVFHRRGSFGRGKYRIRRYGDDEAVFLERKMRQAAVLAKRRTRTPLEALGYLCRPAINQAWSGSWFHRRVIARRLRPVCQVTYHRMARTLARNGEVLRLTLDADVRARASREIRFVAGGTIPVMSAMPSTDGRAILELKFSGTAPALFRRLIEEFTLNPQPASKYRLAVAALEPSLARVPVFSDRDAAVLYA
jgi:hypothetical protein